MKYISSMVKKLIVGFLGLLIVWVIGFSVYLGLRFKDGGKKAAAPKIQVVEWQGDVQKPERWAGDIVMTNEYKKGSYSGIFPGSRKDDVWIVGRKTAPDKKYTGMYFAVQTDTETYTAKTDAKTSYTYQLGDDLYFAPHTATSPATLKNGDFVAVRTTLANNFGLALEIRKLIRQ